MMNWLDRSIEALRGVKVVTAPVSPPAQDAPEAVQYVKIPRVKLTCGHVSGSYATDHDGTTHCLECYNKRFDKLP